MAFGIDDAIAGVSNVINTSINKIWPDPADRARAEVVLLQAQSQAALEMLKAQMAPMLAEAQSNDPWTSRARPSFLYVMYIMILTAIPFGVLSAFSPSAAANVATGMKTWLAAIPQDLWTVFGLGFSVYAGARAWEKGKGVTK